MKLVDRDMQGNISRDREKRKIEVQRNKKRQRKKENRRTKKEERD